MMVSARAKGELVTTTYGAVPELDGLPLALELAGPEGVAEPDAEPDGAGAPLLATTEAEGEAESEAALEGEDEGDPEGAALVRVTPYSSSKQWKKG
jgi:hypothetical protein